MVVVDSQWVSKNEGQAKIDGTVSAMALGFESYPL